jgi:hypothetical protein
MMKMMSMFYLEDDDDVSEDDKVEVDNNFGKIFSLNGGRRELLYKP